MLSKEQPNTNTTLQTFALFPRLPPELRTTIWNLAIGPYLPPRPIRLSPSSAATVSQYQSFPTSAQKPEIYAKSVVKTILKLPSALHVPPFTLLFDYKNDMLLLNDAHLISLELESRDIAAQALRSSGLWNVAFIDFSQIRRLALKIKLPVPGIGAVADVGDVFLELQKSFTGLKELVFIDGNGDENEDAEVHEYREDSRSGSEVVGLIL